MITRRVTPDFSSDLSMGRRPTSKSDEKSGVTLLIVEYSSYRGVENMTLVKSVAVIAAARPSPYGRPPDGWFSLWHMG